MKRSELRNIIKEEISKVLSEKSDPETLNVFQDITKYLDEKTKGLDAEKKKELSKKLSRWLNVMGSLNEGKGYEPIIKVTDDTGYVEVEGPFSVVGDWMYDWFVDNDHIHGFTVEEVDFEDSEWNENSAIGDPRFT